MKNYPISEIFGPTIQAEGIYTGCRTQFIRFAGCDTHCDWCDTKYAWDVKDAALMTDDEIISAVTPASAPIMTITGGNPVLYDLDNLVERLFLSYHEVHVETQGTIWKNWLYQTSFVSVSPKQHHLKLKVLDKITKTMCDRCQIKIIIFSRDDLQFLHQMHKRYGHLPFIVQVGYPSEDNGRWIADYVSLCKDFGRNVRVMIQLHKYFWGSETRR